MSFTEGPVVGYAIHSTLNAYFLSTHQAGPYFPRALCFPPNLITNPWRTLSRHLAHTAQNSWLKAFFPVFTRGSKMRKSLNPRSLGILRTPPCRNIWNSQQAFLKYIKCFSNNYAEHQVHNRMNSSHMHLMCTEELSLGSDLFPPEPSSPERPASAGNSDNFQNWQVGQCRKPGSPRRTQTSSWTVSGGWIRRSDANQIFFRKPRDLGGGRGWVGLKKKPLMRIPYEPSNCKSCKHLWRN